MRPCIKSLTESEDKLTLIDIELLKNKLDAQKAARKFKRSIGEGDELEDWLELTYELYAAKSQEDIDKAMSNLMVSADEVTLKDFITQITTGI